MKKTIFEEMGETYIRQGNYGTVKGRQRFGMDRQAE